MGALDEMRVVINEAGISYVFSDPSGPVGRYKKSVAARCVQLAKALCPVDTGRLRDSIDSQIEGDDIIIAAHEDYAIFVEFGTQHMAAQPFLRPSIGAVTGDAGLEFE